MDESSKDFRTESRDLQVPEPKPDPNKTVGFPTDAEFPESASEPEE